MTRWLLTGAGGQLATAFVEALAGEVVSMAEADADLRDAAAVRGAVAAAAPDIVLHTAAYTAVDAAESDAATAMAVNQGGTRNLVEALRLAYSSGPRPMLVSFSTDYVFDGRAGRPYVESDEPHPIQTYGRSKLASEHEALSWPNTIVIRTAWLFSGSGANFVKTILQVAQERLTATGGLEPLKVVDDQVGSPTYTPHLVQGVLEMVARGAPPGVYHVAGSGYCSWFELAGEALRRAGLSFPLVRTTAAEMGRPAPRPPFSALLSERGAPRLPPWFEGVAEAVARLTATDG